MFKAKFVFTLSVKQLNSLGTHFSFGFECNMPMFQQSFYNVDYLSTTLAANYKRPNCQKNIKT